MADAMHEATLDARHEGGSYRRIEVITGQRRRRRWTAEEKAGIVAESLEAGANISEVARRHGVGRGLLTAWRRQFASAGAKMPSFVPLRIEAEHSAELPGKPGSVAPAPSRPQIASRPGTLGVGLARVCPQLEDSQAGYRVIHRLSGDSELTDAALRASGRSMGQDQGYFART
jgi:transposase